MIKTIFLSMLIFQNLEKLIIGYVGLVIHVFGSFDF